MNIKDLMKGAKNLTDLEFERRLNKLVRENYRYKNLSEDNRKIILDIVDGYKDLLRSGRGVPYNKRQRDMLKLKGKMVSLGLTREDLRDIKEILDSFK